MEINTNLSKPIGTYPNLSEPIQTYFNLSKPNQKPIQDLSEPIQNIQKHIWTNLFFILLIKLYKLTYFSLCI